jgi:hypothetical protein
LETRERIREWTRLYNDTVVSDVSECASGVDVD